MVHDEDEVTPVKDELIQELDDDLEVMDWKEMNELLIKQIDSDRASAQHLRDAARHAG
jgi:hypothetical protein